MLKLLVEFQLKHHFIYFILFCVARYDLKTIKVIATTKTDCLSVGITPTSQVLDCGFTQFIESNSWPCRNLLGLLKTSNSKLSRY